MWLQLATLTGRNFRQGLKRGQRGPNENNSPRFSCPRFRISQWKNNLKRGPSEHMKFECSSHISPCLSVNILAFHHFFLMAQVLGLGIDRLIETSRENRTNTILNRDPKTLHTYKLGLEEVSSKELRKVIDKTLSIYGRIASERIGESF